jgi:hypothetical protein
VSYSAYVVIGWRLPHNYLSLLTSWKSSSWAVCSPHHSVLLVHSLSGRPSVHSVLPCTCRKERKISDFPSRYSQKFVLFSAALFTRGPFIGFPHLAGVHPARFSMSLSTVYTCCTTKTASAYLSRWHDIQILAMLAPVSSISRIPALGRPPSYCTFKFTACLVVSHSTAHTRGRAANFVHITPAKRKLP